MRGTEKELLSVADMTAWRHRCGLSQSKLAGILGLSRDHISKVEQGTRTFTHIAQMAVERASITLALQTRQLHYCLPTAAEDSIMLGLLFQEIERDNAQAAAAATKEQETKK